MEKEYRHILIIDDDEMNNLLNRRFLTITLPKAHVVTMQDSQRALHLLRLGKLALPDLILLDINMPLLNGWQFLDALEKIDCPSDIVILSSSLHELDLEQAKTYRRVRAYIDKPLTDDKIKTYLIERKNPFLSVDKR